MRRRAAAFLVSGQAETEAGRILAALEASPEWGRARCILLYMALPDEVPTQPLLDRWTGRKRLVLPRVAGQDLVLHEYLPGGLQEGYRGILEPSPDAPVVAPSEIDLAIIPGTAFAPFEAEHAFSRLGRGKAYYDRFLPQLHCPTIGLCYSFRVVDKLPLDPWDRPLDRLIC